MNDYFSEFAEKEEILIMKASKRWTDLKSQLMTSKGFWNMRSPEEGQIFKLDKQQDRYHRRFFLKPLKFAERNVYISHEKKLAQAETNKKLAIRLSYCQDSPINRRKNNCSIHKKTFAVANSILNPVIEEAQIPLKDIKETIISNSGYENESLRNSQCLKNKSILSSDKKEREENKNDSNEKQPYSVNLINSLQEANENIFCNSNEDERESIKNIMENQQSEFISNNEEHNEEPNRFTIIQEKLMDKEEGDILYKANARMNLNEVINSQQTLSSNKSIDNLDNVEPRHAGLNFLGSAPMIKFKREGIKSKTNITPIKEINCSNFEEAFLDRIHSDQLLEKKRQNLLENSKFNRSTTKFPTSVKIPRGSKKKNQKSMIGLFKKNRNLQFSHIDLKKFSDKDVEKLEIELKDAPLRDSRKIRASVQFSAESTNQYYGEKINLKGGHYGLIELTRENFIFRSLGVERPDYGPTNRTDVQEPMAGDYLYDLFPLGIDLKLLLNSHCKKQWNLSEIISVQKRSYNLRPCAFELFTLDNKAYLFNVYCPKIAEEIITKFQKIKKNKIDFFNNRSEAFRQSGIQEKWLKGQISNFEYLSRVNTYAGRTYNDINQYPVFPWVLTDYKSKSLDFSNPSIFRNLALPIGALMEKRLENAREHYDTLSQNFDAELHEKPFQYGTHYSGLGPVSYFLVRLEPFTSEHIKLQSGNFDDTDRLFANIGKTWEICYEQDFKELLPELFYLPEILMNKNGFDFGKGNVIGSVELPNWAKTPYEFVFRHREALECDHVSRNLHNWIDLIFGFKQQGKAAIDADNVFRFLTYEGAVDLTKVEDLTQRKNYMEYITKLGQTPHQLFEGKHPKKTFTRLDEKSLFKIPLLIGLTNGIEKFEGFSEALIIKISFSSINLDLTMFFNNNSLVFIPLEHHVHHAVTKVLDSQPKKVQFEMEKKKIFQIPIKISVNEISPASQIYFFKLKRRVVLIGGFYDGSLKIFIKGKEEKKNDSIEFMHKKPINCIGVCEHCKIIACGSKDCRISLWKFDKDMGLKPYIEGGGLIYGHNNEIITLKINDVLDILVSVDRDGVVLMHEIRKGSFLRKVTLDMEREEYVNHLDIHDDGLILIGTNCFRVFIYRYFLYNFRLIILFL